MNNTKIATSLDDIAGVMEGEESMDRLTTNKAVHEMTMTELAYNCCYAKDRKVRYRDYGNDIDARKLAISLLDKFADIPNEFTCDEDFDDFIADCLQYGTDNMLGMIATFYRNLCAMANLRGKLKCYEDLEGQGKLLILPCAVGDTVYVKMQDGELAEAEVRDYTYFLTCGFCIVVTSKSFDKQNIPFSEFGKTVFLTWEAAGKVPDRIRRSNENTGFIQGGSRTSMETEK